ncbi:hypothetical protein RND81_09G031400 [Saponaria officinalis]|uniref:Uncharacterized protein n=1 Tax=Saponaria officinalis TaxID=3572 RepID=A0AAW1IG73_SAPOF
MGGGAAMRTAAKVAGIPSFKSAIRHNGGGMFESPATVAARMTTRPVSATVCDGGVRMEQAVQRPAWELDEWEFASVENEQQIEKQELLISDRNGDVVNKFPRVVFGHVPTIDEAKEATSELKDALEKVYLSSPRSSGSGESYSSLHETKACITHESSVPNGAMQAFMLLNESPAAQTVVASIASDPNVWVAVMQNPSFVEFLESDRKLAYSETKDSVKSSLDAESESLASPRSAVDIDNVEKEGKPEGFMGFIEDVKVTVVDMVSSLTSFVESLFSVPDMEKDKKDGISYDSPKNIFAGGTFMALAMMVIMVVLMKRV